MAPKKKHVTKTTVDLTPIAQLIKDTLGPQLGLKQVLSAGLVALNCLGSDDFNKAMAISAGKKDVSLDLCQARVKLFEICNVSNAVMQRLVNEGASGDIGVGETLESILNIAGEARPTELSVWHVDVKDATADADVSPAARIVDETAAAVKVQKQKPNRPARPKEA